MNRDMVIRSAAEWACSNVGLSYQRIRSGGRVEVGFKKAISRCIRKGRIERLGSGMIRRVAGTIANGRHQ